MEHKFRKSDNGIDLQALLDFCKKEGKMVEYRKGEQLEREGDPARWFGFVESGCFKFITRGFSDGRDHLTWFSFEGEFVADYPCALSGQTSQATIEAMMPCRVWRVSGEELLGSVVLVSWSISTCRISLRSLTSPPRLSARFAKKLLSPINRKTLYLVSILFTFFA